MKLPPKEPIFYGSNRREERRHVGIYRAWQRQQDAEVAADPATHPYDRAEIRMRARMERAESALSPRRLKRLHQRLDKKVPRDLLGRAELRMLRLYEIQGCMDADQQMLANAY